MRTALALISPPGTYPGVIAADAADFTWEAADNVNGNEVVLSEGEIVLVRNDDAGAQTVTFHSVADEFNRTGDITDYSLGPGEYAMFGPFKVPGWAQPGNLLHINASTATVMFAVIKP